MSAGGILSPLCVPCHSAAVKVVKRICRLDPCMEYAPYVEGQWLKLSDYRPLPPGAVAAVRRESESLFMTIHGEKYRFVWLPNVLGLRLYRAAKTLAVAPCGFDKIHVIPTKPLRLRIAPWTLRWPWELRFHDADTGEFSVALGVNPEQTVRGLRVDIQNFMVGADKITVATPVHLDLGLIRGNSKIKNLYHLGRVKLMNRTISKRG